MISTIVKIQLIDPVKGYLDVKENTDFPLNISIADIKDPSKRNGTTSKIIKLAGTRNNNLLLNNYFDVNIKAGTFNVNKRQKCLVLENNIPILNNAYIVLKSIKKIQNTLTEDDLVEYEVQVIDNVSDFFRTISGKELDTYEKYSDQNGNEKRKYELDFSQFNHIYNANNIINSYSNVYSDGYKYITPWINDNKYYLNDLFPGIYVKQLWDKIHERAGFRYEWNDLDSSDVRFDKLILPYNGDVKKLTEEYLDSVETIVDIDSAIEYTNTSSGIIPGLGISGIKINNLNDVIKDPNSWFDAINVLYNNTFSIATPKILDYQITIDYTVSLENLESDNLRWNIAPGVGEFTDGWELTPTLKVKNQNGNTVGQSYMPHLNIEPFNVPSGPLQNLPLGESRDGKFVLYNASDNFTTLQTKKLFSTNTTFTVPVSNILNGDSLELFISMGNALLNTETTGNGSTLQYVRFSDSQPANVKIKLEIDSMSVRIAPNVENGLTAGSLIELNRFIPQKIKQSDFVKSIMNMYNLYLTVDPNDDTKLIYKRRDDYYDSGTIKNWTNKLNRKAEQNLQFLPELSAKRLFLTYKQDSKDAMLTSYFDNVREVYGQVEVIYENENVKGDMKTELIFSPTINTFTPFYANCPIFDNVNNPNNNLRILLDNGELTCPQYAIEETSNNLVYTNKYPFTSMLDKVTNPTFDLAFAPCDYYAYDIVNFTSNNLFINWRRTIAQINSGKMLTAYFNLNSTDISTLKLNDKIRIDNGYFYINKIIDYNASKDGLTKVELLTVEDDLKLPRFGRIIKPGRPTGVSNPKPVGPVLPTGPFKPIDKPIRDIIRNRNFNTSLINTKKDFINLGTGNIINDGFSGMIIGDKITPEDSGVYIGKSTKLTENQLDIGETVHLNRDGLFVGKVGLNQNGITFNSEYVEPGYVLDDYVLGDFNNIIGIAYDADNDETNLEINVTKTTISSILNISNIPAYADDGAADSAGLITGDVYQTDGTGSAPLNVAGILMVKQ